ncbi:hypothetical protein MARU1_000900 [Malassezia arunalokei]|uniref:Importin N-terminal domain-containing protein n=1 Tax=Malassezia arunalokei TaxID=1514897 RepID=A0AAJ6CJ76_9BASI|nr:hypothetical protein MARU1_000900 [Malassezia arunalokei]
MTFSAEALQQVLIAAVQPSDPAVLQRVDEQLAAWETESPFWEALVHAALAREAGYPSTLRQLAMIRFKNGIAKYWRPRIVNRKSVVIEHDAKERIRQRLLDVLSEPDRVVATQGALSVARIMRHDYPDEWPTIVPTLQAALESSSAALHEAAAQGRLAQSTAETLVLLRAADTLRHCVKELESVRIMAGRLRMASLAECLIPVLQPVMERVFAIAFDTNDTAAWAQTPGTAERLRASHLLLKSLHRLSLHEKGLISSRVQQIDSNVAYMFFASTPRQLACVAQRRTEFVGTGHELLPVLTKHMMAYAKLHYAFVSSFQSHITKWPSWTEVVEWYWGVLCDAAKDGASVSLHHDDDDDLVVYPYRWIVLSLKLLHATLDRWQRDRPAGTMFVGTSGAQFELQVVDVLLKTYLRLTPTDLERWQAHPEQFAIEEDQGDDELDIRPAAIELMRSLSRHSFRSGKGAAPEVPTVSDYMWMQFEASAQWPLTLDGVLAREVVYHATGLCRDQLNPLWWYDSDADPDVRMSGAIHDRLIPEAAMDADAIWIIVRRRIVWLLYEWSEFVSEATRPIAYALLVQLLKQAPGYTDATIQLLAARSLAAIADTVDFERRTFLPYLQDTVVGLAHMLQGGIEEPDSIRSITHALCVIMDRADTDMVPYGPALVDMVPKMWARDDPQMRLKPSLLEFVSKLVEKYLPHVEAQAETQALVARLLRDSFEPATRSLLGHDALLLWYHTLASSYTLSAPLVELLSFAPELLGQPEYAPLMCRVWEETVLLAPEDVLYSFGMSVYGAMAQMVGHPNSPVIMEPIFAIDMHVRALPTARLGAMAGIMRATHLDQAILASLCRENDMYHVRQRCAILVSRMALTMPPPTFHDMVRATTRWPDLCRCLISTSVMLTHARSRKLVALGLAHILRHASAEDTGLLSAVPDMIGLWTEVLGEVVEDEAGSADRYEREMSPTRALEIGEDGIPFLDEFGLIETASTPSSARTDAVRKRDPAFTVPLRAYVADTLNTVLQDGSHKTELQSLLATIDPLVLDTLQRGLSERPAA